MKFIKYMNKNYRVTGYIPIFLIFIRLGTRISYVRTWLIYLIGFVILFEKIHNAQIHDPDKDPWMWANYPPILGILLYLIAQFSIDPIIKTVEIMI